MTVPMMAGCGAVKGKDGKYYLCLPDDIERYNAWLRSDCRKVPDYVMALPEGCEPVPPRYQARIVS